MTAAPLPIFPFLLNPSLKNARGSSICSEEAQHDN